MNIYVVHIKPIICANYIDDRRILKSIINVSQILATALRLNKVSDRGYLIPSCIFKHIPQMDATTNHPYSKWARSSRNNYLWALQYLSELVNVASYLGTSNVPIKDHIKIYTEYSDHIVGDVLQKFPNCAVDTTIGADYSHLKDTHYAYRLYLNRKWATDKIAPKWTHRIDPRKHNYRL